jgi:hypothetical protein
MGENLGQFLQHMTVFQAGIKRKKTGIMIAD